jgi:sulfur carrier protein
MSFPSEVPSSFISISVNGQPKEIPADRSISELIDLLGIARDRVAVELNRSIVRKRDWQQTTVTPGSHLEIVEFVGGG